MARTAADDESSDDEAPSQPLEDMGALSLSLSDIQSVLNMESVGAGGGDGRASPKARTQRARTMRRGQSMWGLGQEDSPPVDTSGDIATLSVQDYVKAARALGRDAQAQTMPFRGATEPNVIVHERGSQADITRWLGELQEPSVSMIASETPWRDVEGLLEESADGSLNVKVTSTGIFCAWNLANPRARVKAGDRIAEVNGDALDEQGLRHLRGMGATVKALKLARHCPNAGQLAVLERVASRVSCEWFEERAGTAATSTEEEPMRCSGCVVSGLILLG
jgi:hypothetical protein